MPPNLPPGEHVALRDGSTTLVRQTGNGNGPPLLLIHGWWVNADLNWAYTFEQLAQHHRIITFDLQGHGKGARRKERFSFERCAEDALDVLDHLGVDRALVVGYSMGGCVAQVLAKDHAHRVAGLVLCATAGQFHKPGMDRAQFSLLPRIAQVTRLAPTVLMKRALDWGVPARMRGTRLEPWALQQISQGDLQTLLDAGGALYQFNSINWGVVFSAPVAVVVTTRDRTVPPALQRRLAGALAGAQVMEVRGDHEVCITHPGRFTPVLLKAVESVDNNP